MMILEVESLDKCSHLLFQMNKFITCLVNHVTILLNVFYWFNLGQTTPQTTLFTYSNGESWNTFNNPSFVPIFGTPAVNESLLLQAEQLCNGTINRDECIFDLVVTENIAFVEASQWIQEQEEELDQLEGKKNSLHS